MTAIVHVVALKGGFDVTRDEKGGDTVTLAEGDHMTFTVREDESLAVEGLARAPHAPRSLPEEGCSVKT